MESLPFAIEFQSVARPQPQLFADRLWQSLSYVRGSESIRQRDRQAEPPAPPLQTQDLFWWCRRPPAMRAS
jgi:hypothetical protein